MAVSTRDSGVRVEGLRESLLALNRFDKAVGKEARDLIRDETKRIQDAARAVSTGDPGEASSRAWIGRRVSTKGAGILLNAERYPRALSTEFGTFTHSVYGRRRPARYMRRRVFSTWTGNRWSSTGDGSGRVIQPTIRRMLPSSVEALADGLLALVRRELDRAGVKRGS